MLYLIIAIPVLLLIRHLTVENGKLKKDLNISILVGVEMQREVNRKLSKANEDLRSKLKAYET